MKRFQFIYLSWLIIVLLGCQAQPQQISATTTILTTPPEATPTPTPTQTPVVTSSSTASLPTPTPTQEDTSTPTVAITQFPTTTPGPTPTAMVITPDPNQPECEISPGGFRVDAVWTGTDFCITWVDPENWETRFLIILEYFVNPPNRGEIFVGETFVYEVGPDVTQMIVPKEHSPFPDESPEWCLRRNNYDITVIAVRPDFKRTVDKIATNVDCIPEDPIVTKSP